MSFSVMFGEDCKLKTFLLRKLSVISLHEISLFELSPLFSKLITSYTLSVFLFQIGILQ